MKRFILSAIAVLAVAAGAARAAHVTFKFEEPNTVNLTNRAFYLYPVGGPFTNNAGAIVTRDRVQTNTADGTVTISNVYGWTYRSEVIGRYATTTNYYNFPVTNGTIVAADWTTNGPGIITSYNFIQTDGSGVTNNSSATDGQILGKTGNRTSWVDPTTGSGVNVKAGTSIGTATNGSVTTVGLGTNAIVYITDTGAFAAKSTNGTTRLFNVDRATGDVTGLNSLWTLLGSGGATFGAGAVGLAAAGVYAPLFSGNGAGLTNLPMSAITNGLATNAIVATNSMPWVRVMADGTAFCPTGKINTAGTLTVGINEAVHSLFVTNSLGLVVGGGKIILAPGIYDCATNITIPNQFNFELTVEGSGKANTLLIDSSLTNLFCQEKSTGGDAANGGTKPLQITFRDLGMAHRYDTNKQALVFLDNKLNQGVFENCAFSALQCLAFTNQIGANPVGQGGGLLFVSGTPTNAVGTVGIWINGGFDNKTLVRKCDFYGLAAGIVYGGDHSTFQDCMFTACGRWYTPGTVTAQNGTAWSVAGTFGNHNNYVTNALAVGGGVIAKDNIYEMNLNRCYFFESRAGFINLSPIQGPNANMVDPYWESCAYGILNGLDENDESAAHTSILSLQEFAAFSSGFSAYLKMTNGTISTAVPTSAAAISMLQVISGGGSAPHLKYSDETGNTLFQVDNGTGALVFLGTGTGNGSGFTNLSASELRSGTLPIARLPTLAGGLSSSGTTLTGTNTEVIAGSNITVATNRLAGGLTTFTITGSGGSTDNTAWHTNGNAGVPSTGFLGTTDATPLNLKVNSEGSASFKTNYAVNIGSNQTVSAGAAWSVALGGHDQTVSGQGSFAIGGTNNVVSGANSGAFGISNTVAGDNSFAIGVSNLVNGHNCLVVGRGSSISSLPGTYHDIFFWSDGTQYGPPLSSVFEVVAGNGIIFPTSTLGTADGGGLQVGGAPTAGPGAGQILATNHITAQGRLLQTSATASNSFAGVSRFSTNVYLAAAIIAPVLTKTTNYTFTLADSGLYGDTTDGPHTMKLPASPRDGEIHWLKKISSDGNDLFLDGNGHNIDGTATKTISAQYGSIRAGYDTAATKWFIQ